MHPIKILILLIVVLPILNGCMAFTAYDVIRESTDEEYAAKRRQERERSYAGYREVDLDAYPSYCTGGIGITSLEAACGYMFPYGLSSSFSFIRDFFILGELTKPSYSLSLLFGVRPFLGAMALEAGPAMINKWVYLRDAREGPSVRYTYFGYDAKLSFSALSQNHLRWAFTPIGFTIGTHLVSREHSDFYDSLSAEDQAKLDRKAKNPRIVRFIQVGLGLAF